MLRHPWFMRPGLPLALALDSAITDIMGMVTPMAITVTMVATMAVIGEYTATSSMFHSWVALEPADEKSAGFYFCA
jgi:hypothetical protein